MASNETVHNGSIYSTHISFPSILTLNESLAFLWNASAQCYETINCTASIDSEETEDIISNSTSASFFGAHSQYGNVQAIIVIIILASIILGTVIGNILVCIAVCLVKKLRRPYNYLIVSLAVSDLCVALLVMPMAMLYEVIGEFPFGSTMCDFWVSFDVLSCTASILNLCMISVDRYYAITKPLQYGVKRTPKRMLFYVFIVWFGAACISLPPILILGNEKEESQCIVCQNFAYQIYATMGSFYIPLSVMIMVYYKIFQAARKIVKEEKRAQFHLEAPCYLEINVKNGRAAEAKLLVGEDEGAKEQTRGSNATRSLDRLTASFGRCFSSRQRKSNESQCPMLRQSSSNQVQVVARQPTLPPEDKQKKNGEKVSAVNKIKNSFFSPNSKLQTLKPKEALQASLSPHLKKLRFQLAKEKKASTTLGIIMFSFIICWLPFFVLALVRPFLEDQDSIQTFGSIFLWLGYANSLLNPIIYATLNRDFRKPFQEILFFRCFNLNNIMREEFYHSQYGEPPTHYCAVNSYKPQIYEEDVEIVANIGAGESAKDSATFL